MPQTSFYLVHFESRSYDAYTQKIFGFSSKFCSYRVRMRVAIRRGKSFSRRKYRTKFLSLEAKTKTSCFNLFSDVKRSLRMSRNCWQHQSRCIKRYAYKTRSSWTSTTDKTLVRGSLQHRNMERTSVPTKRSFWRTTVSVIFLNLTKRVGFNNIKTFFIQQYTWNEKSESKTVKSENLQKYRFYKI